MQEISQGSETEDVYSRPEASAQTGVIGGALRSDSTATTSRNFVTCQVADGSGGGGCGLSGFRGCR